MTIRGPALPARFFPNAPVADPRFFIDVDLAPHAEIELPTRVAHHASHVLRLRDGDRVAVFNGRGGEYAGRMGARGTRVELTRHDPVERESPVALTLLQSWVATDKVEWIVEKAVELGASRIVLAPARRSVVQLEGARLAKRIERLREIVIAACCQCGRNRVPVVEALEDLRAAFAEARSPNSAAVVLALDGERSLVEVAANMTAATVAIGPEGGFEKSEVEAALRAGYVAVRLGQRILRTETAGLVALATLQATVGDLR